MGGRRQVRWCSPSRRARQPRSSPATGPVRSRTHARTHARTRTVRKGNEGAPRRRRGRGHGDGRRDRRHLPRYGPPRARARVRVPACRTASAGGPLRLHPRASHVRLCARAGQAAASTIAVYLETERRAGCAARPPPAARACSPALTRVRQPASRIAWRELACRLYSVPHSARALARVPLSPHRAARACFPASRIAWSASWRVACTVCPRTRPRTHAHLAQMASPPPHHQHTNRHGAWRRYGRVERTRAAAQTRAKVNARALPAP